MSDTSDTNPCLACGACCKSYRVSFYWADDMDLGGFAIDRKAG